MIPGVFLFRRGGFGNQEERGVNTFAFDKGQGLVRFDTEGGEDRVHLPHKKRFKGIHLGDGPGIGAEPFQAARGKAGKNRVPETTVLAADNGVNFFGNPLELLRRA